MVVGHDIDLLSTLKEFIRQELRGINTVSMCVVESVNADDRRVQVSLKSDEAVVVDNVPIATPYAADNRGLLTPLSSGQEGFLLHSKEPLSGKIQQRGHRETVFRRRFMLESALFFPRIWLDDMDIPDVPIDSYAIVHGDSDTISRVEITTTGDIELVYDVGGVGTEVRIDDTGVHISAENVSLGSGESSPVLTEDATLVDSQGGSVSIEDPGSTHTEAS